MPSASPAQTSTPRTAVGRRWLLCLLVFATGAAASDMTLERAINLALTQNRELLRSQTLLADSQSDVDAAAAQFDVEIQPLLSVERIGGEELKNYGMQASKQFETGTSIKASATRGDTVLSNGTVIVQPAVSISITQPLFRNLGTDINLATEHSTESLATSARRQYQQMRADMVITVVERYTELFRLQQQVKVDELELEHAAELARLNSAYELVGRTKHLDTLRAEGQHDQAQGALEADRQRLTAAQADFAELLGFPSTSVFITQATGWVDYSEFDVDSALHIALSNRLEYAQAWQDYTDAQRNVQTADNQLKPEVDLTVGYQRFSQSPIPGSNVPAGGGVFVGLSGNSALNAPLARAAVHKSQTNRQAALQNIGIVEAQISRDVQESVSGYQQARTENSIAEHASTSADARLRLARELFHMGRADSFAVADAQQAYVQAQAALLNANAEVTRASYRLSQALGTLLAPPDDLKPPAQQAQ